MSVIEGALLLVKDTLVFSTNSHGIIAVDRNDGSKLWQYSLEKQYKHDNWDYFLSSPTHFNGEIFIGASDGVIRSLDLTTGLENWSLDLTYRTHSKPLVYQNKLYLPTVNALLCIDLETK
ncbi:MAG: PQQ-binding-like beta-propeller repeat protein [Colwellia sp.]|nr:PQQ-binding-like beta-propeller repeat protein [Colwellia sp.]